MANYGVAFTKATTSTTVGAASLEAPATNMRRFSVYDIIVGSPSAAGDGTLEFQVNRSTTASTGTAVVPNALDPADPAAVTVAKSNLTVQGTNTAGAVPIAIPENQRATFRWVARQGSEITVPATANAGIHLNTPVAIGTPGVSGTLLFTEL